MNNYERKVVLVTGGAGGPASLGAEIVRRFHGEGAQVAIADINEEQGAALSQELGDRAFFQRTDITSDQDIEAIVERTISNFGKLDVLVNSACTYAESGLDSSREEWLNLLNVNTVSAALMVKKAIPELKKTQGAIVNFSSVAGKISQAGLFAYSVSKAANLHLTHKLAAELAPDGIRVNAVSPGWTWSDPISMAANGSIKTADTIGARMHPLGRIGRGKDVADAILFLCSDEASFITGVDLPVDGGYTTLGPEQTTSPFEWLEGKKVD
jgi:NAD(P)-dependent dehydrogenase (short-subunit alcohol dehydrogenase family)